VTRTAGAPRRGPLRAVLRHLAVLSSCVGTGLAIGSGGGVAVQGLAAQEPPPSAEAPADPSPEDGVIEDGRDGGWLSAVLGSTPRRDRIIPGLWAMHPFEPQFPELDGTRGFGGLWGHWFGATFVNSYDERTFIAGIERTWLEVRRGPFGTGVGYRVGLITGYDERLIGIARHTPVLPFGGVLLWTQLGPLGLDAYYVYRAITLEVGLVFR